MYSILRNVSTIYRRHSCFQDNPIPHGFNLVSTPAILFPLSSYPSPTSHVSFEYTLKIGGDLFRGFVEFL